MCSSKWFATGIIVKTIIFFMNNVDVLSHFVWLSKTFSTIVTFMIFLSIMKNFDVSFRLPLWENDFHKNHICDLCHKNHIYNHWCDLRKQFWCVLSDYQPYFWNTKITHKCDYFEKSFQKYHKCDSGSGMKLTKNSLKKLVFWEDISK